MRVNVVSPTIQEFDGVRYYLCGYYFQRHGKRLHVVVWKHHNCDVPHGFQVHHVDGDRSNNQIENLQLLSASAHQKKHAESPERKAYGRRHIEDIRPLARKWHGSGAGIAWHREHGKEVWENRTVQTYICDCCGKQFETRHLYGEQQQRFCSNKCKTKARVLSGVDDVERVCEKCGKPFMANKYRAKRFCSRECVGNSDYCSI